VPTAVVLETRGIYDFQFIKTQLRVLFHYCPEHRKQKGNPLLWCSRLVASFLEVACIAKFRETFWLNLHGSRH
jgi:hypothetical protein